MESRESKHCQVCKKAEARHNWTHVPLASPKVAQQSDRGLPLPRSCLCLSLGRKCAAPPQTSFAAAFLYSFSCSQCQIIQLEIRPIGYPLVTAVLHTRHCGCSTQLGPFNCAILIFYRTLQLQSTCSINGHNLAQALLLSAKNGIQTSNFTVPFMKTLFCHFLF